MRHCPRRWPPDVSVSRGASRALPLIVAVGPPPLPHCPPQQSHACSVAGGLVTLLLDMAVDIPRLPHDFMYLFFATLAPFPAMGVCPSGLLGNPLVVGGLLAHQSGWGRLHPLSPTGSSVRRPGGSRPIHLPPSWAKGAEAVAPRRGPGPALMVELQVAASAPVLPAALALLPTAAVPGPLPVPWLLAAWEDKRDVGPKTDSRQPGRRLRLLLLLLFLLLLFTPLPPLPRRLGLCPHQC